MSIRQKILPVIEQKYPSIRPEEIKVFGGGWDFLVYVVRGAEAFRVPRSKAYQKWLPVECAFLEQFTPLSPLKVPALTLHYLEDGSPYATYPFLPGREFSPAICIRLTPTQREAAAAKLGQFLSALHGFALESARIMGVEEVDLLQNGKQKANEYCQWVFPYLTDKEKSWAEHWITAYLQTIAQHPPQKRLIHSDILPEHILISKETMELSGIIDFGDIEISDPALDFTYLGNYSQNFLQTAYLNYSLQRDEFFETRRACYTEFIFLNCLKHAVEVCNPVQIQKYHRILAEHVAEFH